MPHSHPTLGADEAEAAATVVASGRLADGRQVRRFEEALAGALGRRHVVAVANGHQALELWLESQDLPGETPVRMPSYVCAALRHGVARAGLTARVEDVDATTLGLPTAPDGAAPQITIAANMFAIPCSAATGDALEDCAMGFVPGHTGTRSRATLLSFYVTKMLTTGQGGALATDDDTLAATWRDRMQYDNRTAWITTTNRSMTDVQAAIGMVQLEKYPSFLQRRRELLGRYREGLSRVGASLHACVASAADDVLFRLPLEVTRGSVDAWLAHLDAAGIEAKRPVWRPLHRDAGGSPADYPVAEAAWDTIVSLPFYPSLTDADVTRVVEAVATGVEAIGC